METLILIEHQFYDEPEKHIIFEYESLDSAIQLFTGIAESNNKVRSIRRSNLESGINDKCNLMGFMNVFPDIENIQQYTLTTLNAWIETKKMKFTIQNLCI